MTSCVAVVIVNWNGACFLERCLAAVRKQTIKPSEIILVDNASTDSSLEIVGKFPEVRLMAQCKNLGFARANNLAIKAVKDTTEWIVLLNPDAFPDTQWLERLLVAAQGNPGFDCFGSRLMSAAEPEIMDGVGDAYHVSGKASRSGYGAKLTDAVMVAREIFSPCAAAAMYRREALLEVEGFDEDYFCYMEDVDLGFRLRLMGHRCLYVPDSVAYHMGSATTGGQHSEFAVYYGHRNLVWTYVKNMPGVLFWIMLPLHIVMNVATIIWFLAKGRGRAILRAKRDAIRGIPLAWRKRQIIQAGRMVSIRSIWTIMDKRLLPARWGQY